jgi:hypothetical protein
MALAAGSAAIAILVSPVRTSSGRFQAKREDTDELLIDLSRQPFVDAARVLVGQGYNRASVLEMKQAGSDIVALRGPLLKAARLSVEEGVNGPRFVPLRKGLKPCVNAPPVSSGVSVPRTGSPATLKTTTVRLSGLHLRQISRHDLDHGHPVIATTKNKARAGTTARAQKRPSIATSKDQDNECKYPINYCSARARCFRDRHG